MPVDPKIRFYLGRILFGGNNGFEQGKIAFNDLCCCETPAIDPCSLFSPGVDQSGIPFSMHMGIAGHTNINGLCAGCEAINGNSYRVDGWAYEDIYYDTCPAGGEVYYYKGVHCQMFGYYENVFSCGNVTCSLSLYGEAHRLCVPAELRACWPQDHWPYFRWAFAIGTLGLTWPEGEAYDPGCTLDSSVFSCFNGKEDWYTNSPFHLPLSPSPGSWDCAGRDNGIFDCCSRGQVTWGS